MAAKKVRISNDAGTTWEELPGSQAGFDSNAESIEDTILGQSFSSSEIGLVDWSVSSDGIYKGYAGYLAEIKQVGTPVPFTDETMSLVTGLTYAIDDTTKELWNKDVPIVVSDNAVPVATVDIESIDYLYGRITFVGTYSVTGQSQLQVKATQYLQSVVVILITSQCPQMQLMKRVSTLRKQMMDEESSVQVYVQ